MFRPFVDVGLAKAEIADNKMTTKMALNRALKDGDIDMAEQLSKHVNNTESSEKISSLKQTYDKADKDELVLNRQLQKELSRFPNNKNLQSELSKMTYIEKKNLFEELQLDNKLRDELKGLKLKKEDNKNIEGMSYATKKKLLDELPKLAEQYKKIAKDEGLEGPDLEAIVNKAVQDLIAALSGSKQSKPSAPSSVRMPSATVLDLWYPRLTISNQEVAWNTMTKIHKDYAQHGINKPNFIAWYQAKKRLKWLNHLLLVLLLQCLLNHQNQLFQLLQSLLKCHLVLLRLARLRLVHLLHLRRLHSHHLKREKD
jgi:hypothetical protein